jgi:hypothetical protein
MSRQTEYFAGVGSAGVAMLGVGMFAATRAVRARPPCSWGLDGMEADSGPKASGCNRTWVAGGG